MVLPTLPPFWSILGVDALTEKLQCRVWLRFAAKAAHTSPEQINKNNNTAYWAKISRFYVWGAVIDFADR